MDRVCRAILNEKSNFTIEHFWARKLVLFVNIAYDNIFIKKINFQKIILFQHFIQNVQIFPVGIIFMLTQCRDILKLSYIESLFTSGRKIWILREI